MLTQSDMRWWQSPEELAAKKKSGERIPMNEPMAAGQHYEVANLGYVGYVLGLTPEPDGYLYYDEERLPIMGASPDGWLNQSETLEPAEFEPTIMVTDTWTRQRSGRGAVEFLRALVAEHISVPTEMKHVRSRSRPTWNKPTPPSYYENQVRHQLAVLDEPVGLLIARCDAYEIYVHVIEREEGYERLLVEACDRFAAEHLA